MSKKPVAPTVAPAPVMKRANYFLPQDMIDGLAKVAAMKGGTSSEHLRRAVSAYLKRAKVA